MIIIGHRACLEIRKQPTPEPNFSVQKKMYPCNLLLLELRLSRHNPIMQDIPLPLALHLRGVDPAMKF
jgi:hypothetical protein